LEVHRNIMSEPFLEPILRWMRLRKVIAEIPDRSTVLDIGCGTKAALLKAIEPKIKKGVGIDFKVPEFSTPTLKTFQTHLEERLPFTDHSFDVVTMLAVLEHIEYEEQILKEIYRVLKPSGKLILTVPSIWAKPVLEFLSYRLHIIDEREIRDHKRYYNRRLLKVAIIEKSSFSKFKHQYFQGFMNNFCVAVKDVDPEANSTKKNV
jgi:ubiquinone/menaquinone biosynthesis C-methylase UbiE